MRFVYSVVRFIPDPARGEFVNVAAIVGSEESSEWDVRQVANSVRARALDDRRALDAVWVFLDRVGREIDEHQRSLESLLPAQPELTEEWLAALYRDMRNVVQLSPPAPMVAESADEALERIFDIMIIDPAQRRFGFKKKYAALAAVRAAYRTFNIPKGVSLREGIALEAKDFRNRFDFAVVNGRALQLTQTWSFQVPNQEELAEQVKAWGWTVRAARDEGGIAVASDGRRWDVNRDIDVAVAYVPPEPGQDSPALHEALGVFEALSVRHVPAEQAEKIGERAHELLVDAGVGRLDIPPPS